MTVLMTQNQCGVLSIISSLTKIIEKLAIMHTSFTSVSLVVQFNVPYKDMRVNNLSVLSACMCS